MSTTASKNTYRNPKNKKKRQSDKSRIYHVIKWSRSTESAGWTALEMARECNISRETAVKRLSDLFKDGKVRVTGIRNGYSVYKEDSREKRLTLSQAYDEALSIYCVPEQAKLIKQTVKKLI